jgi:Secretory lipase
LLFEHSRSVEEQADHHRPTNLRRDVTVETHLRRAIAAVAIAILAALALTAQARAATPTVPGLTTPTVPGLTTPTAPTVGTPTAPAQTTPPPPQTDPFYHYTGATPLAKIAPGTVLKTRTEAWHVASIPLPVTVVQLLYRTTNARSQPDVNVTSVLLPASLTPSTDLVAYGSFYDSLNPADEPSVVFSGTPYSTNSELTTIETYDIGQMLLSGDAVSVADTEGENADFAAGPEYGATTLDAVRAAINSTQTNVSKSAKVALMGYSGGAIATGWAAQMAPTYAPDVENRLVGATMGGVLVDPDHNLHYIEGSSTWAGVMPMALVGLGRAYGININPYLNATGQKDAAALQAANINTAESDYADITWADIANPKYPEPEDVPVLVNLVNKLTLGSAALPKVPMLVAQGTGGQLDGTQPSATYGPGDGIMIAGDVRSYAREVCASGDPVDYVQPEGLSHELAEPVWSTATLAWVASRFAGVPATSDCSTIAPGNSLAPVPQPK